MLIVFHLASVSYQIKPYLHSSKIIAKPSENDNGLRHAIRDFHADLGNQKHQQADTFHIPTSWMQFSAHLRSQVGKHVASDGRFLFQLQKKKKV